MIGNHESIDVFIGLDVGKGEHHAFAVDRTGMKLLDKALPNDEARLREILTPLGRQGRILLVVEQPATIGALPVAVAQAAGVTVGYLPGLATRRIADLHRSEKPTPGTRSSSPKRPGPCPTPCTPSRSQTNSSPN